MNVSVSLVNELANAADNVTKLPLTFETVIPLLALTVLAFLVTSTTISPA